MENIKKLILEKKSRVVEMQVFEALSKDILQGLNVDLVSVWTFDEDNSTLTCKYSLNRFNKGFLDEVVISEKDFPNYFSGVIQGVSIKADDVYSHPVTRDLSDTYYSKFGILSALDYIIYADGEAIGLVCCEMTSGERIWMDADVDYVRVLTVLAGAELKTPKEN